MLMGNQYNSFLFLKKSVLYIVYFTVRRGLMHTAAQDRRASCLPAGASHHCVAGDKFLSLTLSFHAIVWIFNLLTLLSLSLFDVTLITSNLFFSYIKMKSFIIKHLHKQIFCPIMESILKDSEQNLCVISQSFSVKLVKEKSTDQKMGFLPSDLI